MLSSLFEFRGFALSGFIEGENMQKNDFRKLEHRDWKINN